MSIVNKLAIIIPSGHSWERILIEYRMSSMGLRSIQDAIYDAPNYYCQLHNTDPNAYPISPLAVKIIIEDPIVIDPDGETTPPAIDEPGPGNDHGTDSNTTPPAIDEHGVGNDPGTDPNNCLLY